jgi:GNAT superfamily N-acetyltransferase
VTTAFQVRPATVAEAHVIARHRAEMFSDMGTLPRPFYERLVEGTVRFLQHAMPAGDYLGWFAVPSENPQEIVGGAGILLRRVPPHPLRAPADPVLAEGRQGLVMNVFTERPWRRRGGAELLMRHLLACAAEIGLDTLVLHASDEGRAIYERLGFVATNEMRFAGNLRTSAPANSVR